MRPPAAPPNHQITQSPNHDVRAALLAEKEEELSGLTDLRVSEIGPSRRDFAQFVATQKQGVALVPRLKRRDPLTGGGWPETNIVELARALDDTEAAALAVATAALYGGQIDDLRAVAAATGLAVLRDDLCLHPNHVYQARLYGADAIVLSAVHVAPDPLTELARIARSMHMMSVIEVTDASELPVALGLAPACIGITCRGDDGFTDIAGARLLAEAIPRQRTVLLLSESRSLDAVRQLEGLIDAAVVGDLLLNAADPVELLASWTVDQP